MSYWIRKLTQIALPCLYAILNENWRVFILYEAKPDPDAKGQWQLLSTWRMYYPQKPMIWRLLSWNFLLGLIQTASPGDSRIAFFPSGTISHRLWGCWVSHCWVYNSCLDPYHVISYRKQKWNQVICPTKSHSSVWGSRTSQNIPKGCRKKGKAQNDHLCCWLNQHPKCPDSQDINCLIVICEDLEQSSRQAPGHGVKGTVLWHDIHQGLAWQLGHHSEAVIGIRATGKWPLKRCISAGQESLWSWGRSNMERRPISQKFLQCNLEGSEWDMEFWRKTSKVLKFVNWLIKAWEIWTSSTRTRFFLVQ